MDKEEHQGRQVKKLLLVSLLLVSCATNKPNRKYDCGDVVLLSTGERGVIQNISQTTGYNGIPAYYIRLDNIKTIAPEQSYDLSIRIYEFEITKLIDN